MERGFLRSCKDNYGVECFTFLSSCSTLLRTALSLSFPLKDLSSGYEATLLSVFVPVKGYLRFSILFFFGKSILREHERVEIFSTVEETLQPPAIQISL